MKYKKIYYQYLVGNSKKKQFSFDGKFSELLIFKIMIVKIYVIFEIILLILIVVCFLIFC